MKEDKGTTTCGAAFEHDSHVFVGDGGMVFSCDGVLRTVEI